MLSDTTGIIHFLAAILALITGTIVLIKLKGTKRHKMIGYAYSINMVVLLITSFMMYNLNGNFNIFHCFAVISSLSLLGGMLPMLLKWPEKYLSFHFSFMYWSVIGLYCALAAEVLTRIPYYIDFEENIVEIFYALVGIATALVGGIGSVYFRRYKKKWENLETNMGRKLEA